MQIVEIGQCYSVTRSLISHPQLFCQETQFRSEICFEMKKCTFWKSADFYFLDTYSLKPDSNVWNCNECLKELHCPN